MTNSDNRSPPTSRTQRETEAVAAMLKRIDDRVAELGIPVSRVLHEAGINQSVVKNMRNRQAPGVFKSAALAKRLGVSLDYLTGLTPTPSLPLDGDKFIRVVARVIELISREALTLSPKEAAEMALHVYNKSGNYENGLAEAIIRWLDGAKRP